MAMEFLLKKKSTNSKRNSTFSSSICQRIFLIEGNCRILIENLLDQIVHQKQAELMNLLIK